MLNRVINFPQLSFSTLLSILICNDSKSSQVLLRLRSVKSNELYNSPADFPGSE